jgi:hypothetical protein
VSVPADAQGTALRAMVDWGDGSVSAATVDASGAVRTINAGHTYAARGRYTFTVAVSDAASGAVLTRDTRQLRVAL